MTTQPQRETVRYAPLAETVRRCEASRRALRIVGGRTLADFGPQAADDRENVARPPSAGLADNCGLLQYADLITHDRQDMTVTVQAGMTVARLQALLARHNQCLPIDVPLPERTTVGGMIAANLSGPRRHAHGTVRDLLIGVGVVGASGEFIRGGGRVVKNVAGYDLCKLYTGSWGWLGVIVEATFRVSALPEAAAALLVPVDTAAEAEATIAHVLHGTLRPASIDLLNAAAVERPHSAVAPAALAFAQETGQRPVPQVGMALLLGFEGMREDVDAQVAASRVAQASRLCPHRRDAGATAPLGRGRAAEPAILPRDAYRTAVQAICDLTVADGVCVKFSLLSTQVTDFILALSEHAPHVPVAAHAAEGVVHALFDRGDVDAIRGATERVTKIGGSWLIPRYPSDAGESFPPMLGPPRDEWKLMCRLKRALDPRDVFERGSPFDRALRAPATATAP